MGIAALNPSYAGFGYVHIPQQWAARINAFSQTHLIPHLNFHRPCFFPEALLDEKSKQRKRYRYEHMMTLHEKLKSLSEARQYLKERRGSASISSMRWLRQ